MVSGLPVLMFLGCFSGCRGSGSTNGHDNIEIHEVIDGATQPSCFIVDFGILLGGERECAMGYSQFKSCS